MKKETVWNFNFFLLWQGQLISGVGDFFYQIALGFWILAVTGSTSLMATVMAASLIPQIFISPAAGVIVDRVNRKGLIIAMDIIKGTAVLLVSAAAFMGILKVWMVFWAGAVLGVCLAFFNPAMRSAVSDIVPRSQMVKANAAFASIYAGSKVIGDTLGGFLFQVLGVQVLFLINGLSYLFSAVTEAFVFIPNTQHKFIRQSFFEEMKSGFLLIWKLRGLRFLFINTLVTNFFSVIAYTVILPLFYGNPQLGAARYGLVMGTAALGAFGGFLYSTLVYIKPRRRFFLICFSGGLFSLCRMVFPFFLELHVLLPLMFVSGVAIAVSINLFEAVLPLVVPNDKRGKVFASLNMVTSGIWPLSMITAGVLAEFIPLSVLISVTSGIAFLSYGVLFCSSSAKEMVNGAESEGATSTL